MTSSATVQNSIRAVISIPARFAQVVARHPNRVAISTPETQWTYAELDQHSTAQAAQILGRAGNGSEVVALLLPHGPRLIAAILGVLKAGRIYLALDAAEPSPRLTAMLEDSRTNLLLTDSSNLLVARSFASDRLTVTELSENPKFASNSTDLPEVPAAGGAWLMYTSGSTGAPKGVWQDHRSVIHHADVYSELIKLTLDDRLSLLTSLSLAASATHLFTALLNGAALCPFHARTQGVGRLAQWLEDQRVTILHSVPTVFRHLLRAVKAGTRLQHLRLIRLGGEPVLQGDVELFRQQTSDKCVLMHALSSTETGLTCALLINRQTTLPQGRVPVGRAVCDVEVLLTDEHGQLVGENSEGRIAVRSAFLSKGYWQRPEATAALFRADTHDPDRRLFITGDLGRFQPDGVLEHLGRVDQQVKIRGQRVDLAEVEAALRAVEEVEDAAVLLREEPSGEKSLVAYVVTQDRNADVSRTCHAPLRTMLPHYMIPSEFIWLEKLPQTSGGKLDRLALPPPPMSPAAEPARRHGPKPRDGVERKVARVWESVLGIPTLSRADDFFELGANSLQATEALVGLEETFGVVLPPSALIENSTVESLAALIADHTVVRSERCLVTLRAANAGRPLFLVHSGHGDVATYAQLARQLPERPIYGLQAVGLQGESWPQMSIRAMARRYLPEIIAVQPQGPYLLGGTCMGGLVAFELAGRLVEQGHEVRFLGMMDTTAPPFGGRRSPWNEMLLDPLRDTLRIARWAVLRALGHGRSGSSLPAYRHFIGSITSRARYYYRPGLYPGTITMFATTGTVFPRGDRRPLMGRYAKEMRYITIPGRREELFLRPAVEELARQLAACLAAAESPTTP